jgi:sulfatase-like protein
VTRAAATAAARTANAAFLLSIAAFAFLSYSPFAYAQFIKPNVVPDLNDFVVLSPWIFTIALLVTTLTLLPQLRESAAPGSAAARAYAATAAAIALWALWRRPLTTIGDSVAGFFIGLGALALVVALAIVDHAVWPAPVLTAADRGRAMRATVFAAAAACAAYAIGAPLRLQQAVGIEMSAAGFGLGVLGTFAGTLFVFTAILLALIAATAIAGLAPHPPLVEYWLFTALLASAAALVFYFLVSAAIAWTGRDAGIASGALGLAIGAGWSDVARLRSHSAIRHRPSGIDSLSLSAAPVAGAVSRRSAAAVLAALPFAAYALTAAVSHLDWNFLLQKLGVLVVWLVALAATYGATAGRRGDRRMLPAFALSLLAFALHQGVMRLPPTADAQLDRYAAVDPSLRLLRDAQVKGSADTAEYYAYLRSQTLVLPGKVRPPDVAFVDRLGPARVRPPHIFLFIVDSLRRDYVSVYNPKVTFTPQIARLAADSFVFDRAFTRYAGTALAVPSIWAGGLTIHTLEQYDFARRNTLLKMLDANRYVRMMDFDHLVEELVPHDANSLQLDRGKGTMDIDVCATTTELEERLDGRDRARPVFFYSLPQNVHIAVATRVRVPADRYPGFYAPIAASLERIDGCLGGFVDYLKARGLYDDSVLIVTSDHGDSLGEEGRWGHAYFMVPEVMRIPLIVHLPPRLREGVAVDRAALAFSADIVPSLYALLGYDPIDRGRLYGRPLFTPPDGDSSWRWRGQFLVASSYGAVYGIVRQNGRRLDVIDAVGGRDAAYDLSSGLLGRQVEETRAMSDESRREVARQLGELASVFHYHADR